MPYPTPPADTTPYNCDTNALLVEIARLNAGLEAIAAVPADDAIVTIDMARRVLNGLSPYPG